MMVSREELTVAEITSGRAKQVDDVLFEVWRDAGEGWDCETVALRTNPPSKLRVRTAHSVMHDLEIAVREFVKKEIEL